MSSSNGHIQDMARLFRILGDGTRLRILLELQAGQLNVGQLCRKLRAPQPTVSHHLGLLRMVDLVQTRRSGKKIFYSLPEPDRHPYSASLKALLKKTSAMRLGPLVLGAT
jgi:DNA-binding transcriptional ArsR family regulator